jgi:hypothetical protein
MEIESVNNQKMLNPASAPADWKQVADAADKVELIKDMTHTWGRYKRIYTVTKDNQTKTYLVD